MGDRGLARAGQETQDFTSNLLLGSDERAKKEQHAAEACRRVAPARSSVGEQEQRGAEGGQGAEDEEGQGWGEGGEVEGVEGDGEEAGGGWDGQCG